MQMTKPIIANGTDMYVFCRSNPTNMSAMPTKEFRMRFNFCSIFFISNNPLLRCNIYVIMVSQPYKRNQ